MTMEHDYERGAYFKENSHPNVRGKVILGLSDDLHGEPGYRLAEKDTDTGTWFDYWQPARHLHDEVGVGACEKTGELDEDKLSEVEEQVAVEPADAPEPLEEVTRVKDVMDDAAVEAITNTED